MLFIDKKSESGIVDYSIQLEGFNFEEVSKYSELSIQGIESCRSAIVKEIVNVFDVYSIKVNKRYL